jgi:hypothetical protein
VLPHDPRSKIKNITAGIIIEGSYDHCTTIRNILCTSFPTSTTVKEDFEGKSVIKEKQAVVLKEFCNKHNLWVTNLPGDANSNHRW